MRTGIALVILCLLATVARADDKAAAEAAFVKAKRLMKEGKTAEACSAFATSLRLDPQHGTRYNLALCHEQQGKLASAWVAFREVAQRDTNAARKQDSAKRADAIEPRLSRLLIEAPSVAGLVVTRDGVDVTNLLGVEDPVDPGTYRIVATAGGQRFEKSVEVAGEGAVVKVDVELTEAGTDAGAGAGPDAGAGPGAGPDPGADPGAGAAVDTDAGPGGGRTILGLSAAGAGAVALGVGLYFGSRASADFDAAKDVCGGDLVCDNEALRLESQGHVDDARGKATLSTIFVGAGVVAVTAGVILWLTAPEDGGEREPTATRLAPQVGPDSIGLVAAGRF